MLYSISFRWTEITGGENGLGGITRPTLFGFDLESSTYYYWFVALIAYLVLILLWRFYIRRWGACWSRSETSNAPVASAIRPTATSWRRFVVSATIVGLAGILS